MFTNSLVSCPACNSNKIVSDRFISHERFMSVPGLNHSNCLNCKTIFLNPQPNEQELKSFYNSQTTEGTVDEIVLSGARRVLELDRKKYFENNRVNPIVKYLPQNAKVFDVGCGVGAFLYSMKERGYIVSGCDLSKVSVVAGREVLKLNEDQIFVGDNYSLPAEEFDLITMWTVIEHLLNPSDYLNYLRDNHIKKNGYLLMEFPTIDSSMFEHLGEHYKWVMPPYHLNLFSKEGMNQLLYRNGFEVVLTHQMPKNWYFFESIARKVGISEELIRKIEIIAPGLSFEIDKIFDLMSLELNKSSTIWVLAKKR